VNASAQLQAKSDSSTASFLLCCPKHKKREIESTDDEGRQKVRHLDLMSHSVSWGLPIKNKRLKACRQRSHRLGNFHFPNPESFTFIGKSESIQLRPSHLAECDLMPNPRCNFYLTNYHAWRIFMWIRFVNGRVRNTQIIINIYYFRHS
jgi:hypothetical protein